MKIGRLIGIDEKGVLYIGKSSNLSLRIRQLKNDLAGESKNHTIGRKFDESKKLRDFIPVNCIIVEYKEYPISELSKQENKLIDSYFKKYGEVPPLNSNSVKKK